jgi:hypothetical protein
MRLLLPVLPSSSGSGSIPASAPRTVLLALPAFVIASSSAAALGKCPSCSLTPGRALTLALLCSTSLSLRASSGTPFPSRALRSQERQMSARTKIYEQRVRSHLPGRTSRPSTSATLSSAFLCLALTAVVRRSVEIATTLQILTGSSTPKAPVYIPSRSYLFAKTSAGFSSSESSYRLSSWTSAFKSCAGVRPFSLAEASRTYNSSCEHTMQQGRRSQSQRTQ